MTKGRQLAPITYNRDALLSFKNHKCVKTVEQIAINLPHDLKRRQRGKRGGQKRRSHHHRKIPLPALVFANARSINNKTNELASLIGRHQAFKNASAIGITESWLNSDIDDNIVNFDGFNTFRTDRDPIITGKKKGGGCLWLINKQWCTNITIHRRYCSKELELLHLECRPHYLPREINIVNLILVYCVPGADEKNCVSTLEDVIDQCNVKHPDAANIIVGDFNHVKLKHLHQYVNFPTRDNATLDLCYSNIRDAYKAYKLPAIGASDHSTIQLSPTYVAKHRKTKNRKLIKTIIDDACIETCQATFHTTDWETLLNTNIDQSADVLSSYINFTIESNSASKEVWLNHNSKPWLTSEIKELIKQRWLAKSQVDADYKAINKSVNELIATAKAAYKAKTLDRMTCNIKSAWDGIKSMSHLNKRPPDISTSVSHREIPQLANDLNNFYLRFEQPQTNSEPPNSTSNTESSPIPFTINEVYSALKKCKPRKASGPDGVPAKVINACAYELAEPLKLMFNRCLASGYIPSSWKHAELIPVPKKPQPSCLNDYRPIALTPILMKCFEHLIKGRLTDKVRLDEYQYAYKKKRSTKDACLAIDYTIRKHLEKPNSYARVLFIDFSSAFNTLLPTILSKQLHELGVDNFLIKLIMSFLSNRKQHVRIGEHKSSTLDSNTGCPQGCVLSPLLFSIYTDAMRSQNSGVQVFKYADDTAIVGLLNHLKPDNFYFDAIKDCVSWCKSNNLILNTSKTKEMVFDFSKSHDVTSSVFIDGIEIERVLDFKYLGTFFSEDLKWHTNSDKLYKKIKSRFYAFSKFKSFNPSNEQCFNFIQSLVLPILLYNSEMWFYSCTESERSMLLKPFQRNDFNCDIRSLIDDRIFSSAVTFYSDQDHVLNPCYVSNRKYFTSAKCRTTRFLNSFVPYSIRL